VEKPSGRGSTSWRIERRRSSGRSRSEARRPCTPGRAWPGRRPGPPPPPSSPGHAIGASIGGHDAPRCVAPVAVVQARRNRGRTTPVCVSRFLLTFRFPFVTRVFLFSSKRSRSHTHTTMLPLAQPQASNIRRGGASPPSCGWWSRAGPRRGDGVAAMPPPPRPTAARMRPPSRTAHLTRPASLPSTEPDTDGASMVRDETGQECGNHVATAPCTLPLAGSHCSTSPKPVLPTRAHRRGRRRLQPLLPVPGRLGLLHGRAKRRHGHPVRRVGVAQHRVGGRLLRRL